MRLFFCVQVWPESFFSGSAVVFSGMLAEADSQLKQQQESLNVGEKRVCHKQE